MTSVTICSAESKQTDAG